MENTMEIMVNENKEVMEEAAVEVAKRLDIKELAKKGGKAALVGLGAVVVYKTITKGVPALINGSKKLYNKYKNLYHSTKNLYLCTKMTFLSGII